MKYTITVSEPWDFASSDGINIIKGTIIHLVNDKCIIFRSDKSQQFEQGKGRLFVLFPRVQDYTFSEIEKNKSIDINGGLLNSRFNYKNTEEELVKNSTFVIIGSISKEQLYK